VQVVCGIGYRDFSSFLELGIPESKREDGISLIWEWEMQRMDEWDNRRMAKVEDWEGGIIGG